MKYRIFDRLKNTYYYDGEFYISTDGQVFSFETVDIQTHHPVHSIADACFQDGNPLKHKAIVEYIKTDLKVKDRQAKNILKEMVDLGLIAKQSKSKFSPYIKTTSKRYSVPASLLQKQEHLTAEFSTGRTDKDGRTMYELDLYKHKLPSGKYSSEYIIAFSQKTSAFMLVNRYPALYPELPLTDEVIANLKFVSELQAFHNTTEFKTDSFTKHLNNLEEAYPTSEESLKNYEKLVSESVGFSCMFSQGLAKDNKTVVYQLKPVISVGIGWEFFEWLCEKYPESQSHESELVAAMWFENKFNEFKQLSNVPQA